MFLMCHHFTWLLLAKCFRYVSEILIMNSVSHLSHNELIRLRRDAHVHSNYIADKGLLFRKNAGL